MTAHTPGPYRVVGTCIVADTPQDIDHARYKGFNVKEPYDNGYLIAESVPHRPTADLLAAAPDLLEALEAIAEYGEAHGGYVNAQIDGKSITSFARAAIAKAKGPD